MASAIHALVVTVPETAVKGFETCGDTTTTLEGADGGNKQHL